MAVKSVIYSINKTARSKTSFLQKKGRCFLRKIEKIFFSFQNTMLIW